MYIQGMAQQTQIFLLCTGFGFLAGAVYDILRFVRKIFSSGYKAIIVQDISFFLILTPAAFLFMLCIDDGELRFYPYLGMLAGFFIWYFTLGILAKSLLDRVSLFLGRFFRPIIRRLEAIFGKTMKILKKIKNKHIKPLEKSADDSV